MPATKQRRTKRGKPGKGALPPIPKTRVQRVWELMGKYAHLSGGSEEFAREKAREIARER